MKVLYINTLYSPHIGGGAEITLKALVEGIARRGHDVTVLTTGPQPGIHQDIVDGIPVVRVGIKNNYWHYRKNKVIAWRRILWHLMDTYNPMMGRIVENVVRQINPDVVNCHNLAGFSVSAFSAIQRTGIPIMQVLHDLYNICPNSNMFRDGKSCEGQCVRCKMFRLLHTKASKRVDAVIGVSKYVLQRHLDHGLFANAKIKAAIYNAREMKATLRNGPAELGTMTFGFIGTLTQAKGIELLIKAFNDLNPGEKAKLLIAGTGIQPYETNIKRNESNNIKFLGHIKPEEFFPLIDVLVVPSLWNDTLPSVVFEAFSYGVPVIGSFRGGIPELIQDGINGYLFEPNDIDDLIRLLDLAVHNQGLFANMSTNALQASEYFTDIDNWIAKYENIILDIINPIGSSHNLV